MNGAMSSTNNSGNQSALFNHSNVSISGGTFILNHINSDQNTEAGLNRAFQEVVVAAMHDNNDLVEVPKCHPGTRTALIGGLIMRARDTDADRFLIWLVGPVGAGKSAIARSFAEEMDKAGIRFASFCFFRTDPGRNSVKGLIVTLAFQISNSIPEFKPYLRQAVADDATILRRSLSSQFEKLITLPLRQLLESNPSHNFILQPFLILVDGLDECVDRKSRCLFLQLVHKAIPTIPGLRFVFTSRPEEDIQTQFDRFGNEEYDKIELLANLSAYEDIRTFLGAEFERIRTTHPLRKVLKDDWPSSHDIEDLLRKSSGHFIYPATAIKYIEYSLDNPQRSLQVILGLRTSSRKPLADLDALYSSILESSRAEPQTLRDILSVLIALSRSGSNWEILLSKSRKVDPVETTTHLIETLLGLEEGDTQLAFLDITSIIKHDSASATLSFHHRSFVDFLCDRSRSGPYFINLLPSFGLVIKNCLQVLSKPHTFFNAKSPNHLLKNTYHSIIMNCFETIHPEFPQFFIEIHDLFMSYKPLDADDQDFIKRKKFYAGQFLEICDFYKPHLNDDSLFKHHLAQLDASLISDIHMMSWPPVVTRHFLTLSILPDAFQSFHTDIPLDKYRNPEVLYKLFPALETLHPSLSLKYYSSPYFRQVGKFFFSKERAGSYWINEDSLVSATIWCIQNFLQVVDPISRSRVCTPRIRWAQVVPARRPVGSKYSRSPGTTNLSTSPIQATSRFRTKGSNGSATPTVHSNLE
ncbi:hypothetical protein CPB83DRAFT_504989 [Crepidotus variabilis]|uniref:NACHT domain-containing protein n=1 Tax=Crepidotus variabilis TaxID=179855 RepID=A0A9P6EBU6_9AGAR|nr:hypothetical protein CPB83DRAFT_504989 [Crepidotus variabilis]